MNTLYKWAVSVLLVGVVIDPVVNYLVDTHMGQNPFSWDIFLTILVAVTAAAVLGIIGYMKSKPKDAKRKGI
jgi:hypothetical protein